MTQSAACDPDALKRLDARLLAATPQPPSNDGKPIEVGRAHQLFVDDHLVDRCVLLHRRLSRPRKRAAPVLAPAFPWEGNGLTYGTAIPHEGRIRLYYHGMHTSAQSHASFRAERGYTKTPIALALSEDGVHFSRKPLKGAALPRTNIVLNDVVDCFSPLKDEASADSGRRFKALGSFRDWEPGLTLASSPDGIRWTLGKEHAVADFGDRNSFWFDPRRKLYVAWSRCMRLYPTRVIVQMTTPDFDDWSDPRRSFPKLVLMPDRHDHPQTQFYGGYAFWYHSLYLGYLEIYHRQHARLDTQLVSSRDGVTWRRLGDREPFLPNGDHGAFDSYWITPTFNPPISRGGKLLIHYHGHRLPHIQLGHMNPPVARHSCFGLATLREDGFVSLDATGIEGLLLTKPLAAPPASRGIEINVAPFVKDAATPLRVRVDLLSASCRLLESHVLETPSTRPVLWQGVALKKNLPPTFRLLFRPTNARLYAFRVRETASANLVRHSAAGS